MRSNAKPKEYTICVKLDTTVPWIELDKTYETLPDAWRAAERLKQNLRLKVVESPKLVQEKHVLAVPGIRRSAARKRR